LGCFGSVWYVGGYLPRAPKNKEIEIGMVNVVVVVVLEKGGEVGVLLCCDVDRIGLVREEYYVFVCVCIGL
jgi:hypothetical protein